jgi:hypothetical protein
VLLRRVRDSVLDEGGTRDGGGELGMEEPDEAGSKGLEAETAPVL